MNKQDKPLSQRLIFGGLLAGSIFITGVGFLGFVGWWGHPSDQKWAALGCSLFGAVATFILWKAKDADLKPRVDNADDIILTQPVEEQQRYWKKVIRESVTGGAICAGVMGLLSLFLTGTELTPDLGYYLAYVCFVVAWRIFRATRELAKLRSR